MADFSTDNASDSFVEGVKNALRGHRDEEYLSQLSDFSQWSSGRSGVCESVFQNCQDGDSRAVTESEAEDSQTTSEMSVGRRYLALRRDASIEGCAGSPSPGTANFTAPSESSITDSTPDGLYSSSTDFHCLADSLHNGQSQEDVPCGPPPYCSYWGNFQSSEEPSPHTVYSAETLQALLTPPDSPQPESRLQQSAVFLDTVKACVACAVRSAVLKQIKEVCFGCQIDHPSQRQHGCLYPPEPGYYETHFEELMLKVLTWEFLPALKSTLQKIGVEVLDAKLEGAADAFLHDLKPEQYILEKVEAIIEVYVNGNTERELLLEHFINFWNP